MNDICYRVVSSLKDKGKTVSTMESCTGGGVVNSLTNIEGSSEVISFSAVTYSDSFKIKMGVDKELLNKYSVYSMEVAKEMAYQISKFARSTYGIGITGVLSNDKDIPVSKHYKVWFSIYDSVNKCYYNRELELKSDERSYNKDIIIMEVLSYLEELLNG